VLQLAIKGAPHSSSKNTETTPHCCCCVLLYSFCESLRAQNSREQPSETSSSCDTCTGRRAINFLGSATLHNYSLVRMTTSWWCELPFDYFLIVCAPVPLFLEGRSWDDIASILPASNYTSSCSTCRLLETAPLVPSALVVPLGTTWSSLIYLSCSFCSYTT
jgi:hypothetical protein